MYFSSMGRNEKITYDVYVGHVPKSVQQDTLIEVFSKHGEVVDVLIRHATGPLGYAIVKFKHKKAVDKVLREVATVYVGNHEMEVKNGKRSNQAAENCNGTTGVKTVSFADPITSIQPVENAHFIEQPLPFKDCKYVVSASEEASVPFMVEIMCTNVEDAVTFHGYTNCRLEELQVLSAKLNSICPNLVRLPRKPALRKIYGALYKEDCQWYRCRVLQYASPVICCVEYIDYGNIAEISYTDMVELPEPIKNINPFAIKCVFSNLMPSVKSQNGVTYLHHLVNRRMSLFAFSSFKPLEYQVLKCSCNGIDVITELVRNGYAIPRYSVSPRTSQSSHNFDKTLCSKMQENHKSKKVSVTYVNGKSCDASNSIEKQFYEKNGGINDQEKNCKSSTTEPHPAQDFIPKKIIKRGSDTSVINHQASEETKTVNHLLKVDAVMSNLKLVNNIRGLVPLHTDEDLINKAIDLLRNVMNVTASEDSRQLVENAYKKYSETLKDLKGCSEEEMLLDLKKKRNRWRIELYDELKRYLETFDSTLLEKRRKIQETITELESNSSAWLNVYLSRIPDTTEDLLEAFNEEKEKKRSSIELARKNTDEKHEKFQKFLDDLGKEFTLNMVDGKTDDSYSINTAGKKGSWALKFDEVLTEFGIALEQEMASSTVSKDRNSISVIQCILEKLDIPKEQIDAECELHEKYQSLYDELTYASDLSPVFDAHDILRKTIMTLSSYLNDENIEQSADKFLELHSTLLREDALLVDIAKAAARHFPELVHEHPELELEQYQKYSCLLKSSWDIKFFPHFEECSRIEPSYISKFVNEPVVLKEFNVNCDSEEAFMKKAVAWNEIRKNSVVKIKGLFKNKDGNIIYAVLSSVWSSLYDEPLAVPVDFRAALIILQKVLEGLCDIHSRGIVHGAVHPMSILHNEGEILLDFNFDKQYLQDKLCLKGINFQVPKCGDLMKSSDMYGFGCLVLWVLFPNLSFHSTDQGVPDINPFLSIIQGMMFDKDFNFLCALLNVNSDVRPSSRVLLSNRFLKDLRIISKAAS